MNRFANACATGARATLVLCFLAFPMSVALANVALLLTLLLWLLSLIGAPARAELMQALRNPLAAPALALFAWVVIAVAWSPADAKGALGFLQKYLKFLLVPMFIALLQDARTRRRCWHAFVLALLFTLAVTWLSVWVDIPWTKASRLQQETDHTVFKDHISQGLLMTVFAIITALVGFTTRRSRLRWTCAVLWLLATGAILALSQGRTGYLTWVASSTVFALTLAVAHSRRAVLGALAGLGATLALAFALSPVLQARVTAAWDEARAAQLDTTPGATVTSAGARVEMARFALDASSEAPLLGHGTASYPVLAKQHFTTGKWCSVVCPHPHNQFLFFLVEQGAVGLLLFLWFIAAIAREGWRHDPPRRAFALAFVATLCAASLTHSAFWLSTESHCLILMSALTMASLRARRARALE
jgi:O-antigen ligase